MSVLKGSWRSVAKNVGAHSSLHGGLQGRLAKSDAALPAGDQNDGRGGSVLEPVDLVAELGGKVFLDVKGLYTIEELEASGMKYWRL